MTEEMKDRALAVAREIAQELVEDGAKGVILTGSWARGDAHRESDLDLRVVGDEEPKKLQRREGFLVSTASMPEEKHREQFDAPEEVGSIVPGWRSAVILADPDGVAKRLQNEAAAWEWARIDGSEADAHVATEITKLAEEVHSLYSNLDQDNIMGAAMQRATIALETAPVMAVHHRILYESEKKLWELVAEQHGDDWTKAQEGALAQNGEGFRESCDAAFRLFAMAAETTRDLLDDEQRPVVEHALELDPSQVTPR